MSVVINPNQNWNIVAQGGAIANAPQRVLLIGQQASSATATAGQITGNIGNNGQEDALFGRRSMAATMCRTFKRYNKVSQLDMLSLEDPSTGPANATATLTFAGTATQAGTLRIAVQSERYYIFEVGVAVGVTGVTAAGNLNTAINASDTVLVTSGIASDVVTLTAFHPGTDGNNIKLRILDNVPGITITDTAFSGGAGAVEAVDFDAVIGERRYQTIVIPSTYSTNLTALKDYLEANFNASNRVKDGVAFTCTSSASEAAAVSFANPFDSKCVVALSDETIAVAGQRGGNLVEYNPSIASYFAAVRSLRLTLGANIAQYLVGSNISNTQGGGFRAALPYHQTPFVDLPTIAQGRGWSLADQQLLTSNAVSFFGNDITGARVVCGDIVTTYRGTDQAYKYLNTVDTVSQIREFFFNNCQARFAQCVLTDGGLSGPNTMANAAVIKSYLGSLYQKLAGKDWGLCQSGAQALKYFNDNCQVEVVMSTGTVNVVTDIPIVSQLRNINGTIAFSFTV